MATLMEPTPQPPVEKATAALILGAIGVVFGDIPVEQVIEVGIQLDL
jgi:hypothetical protein